MNQYVGKHQKKKKKKNLSMAAPTGAETTF